MIFFCFKGKVFHLLNLFFLISIFFLSNCNVFSQDIRFPNIPVYENPDLIPHKMDIKYNKKFKKLYRKKIFSKLRITYKSKNHIVYLLDKNERKVLEKSNIPYERLKKSVPFKYYDIGYYARSKKEFSNLSDLRKGYKDQRLNRNYLKRISEKYPDKVSYFELGQTRLGRSIPAIKITSPKKSSYKIPILFTGAHHANELISTEHCYDIIFNLLEDYDKYEPYLENIAIWIVPIVNPDGSHFFWNHSIDMGRKNGFLPSGVKGNDVTRGVDLNRNYPYKWNSGQSRASSSNPQSSFYRGLSAGSEPETKAMMSLAEREKFLFAMSFHSFATAILYPYTIETLSNPDPDYVKELATRLAANSKSARINKEFRILKNLYPVDGTDQDYYYHEYGTNAFIAESSHQNVDYSIVPYILKGFKGVWENLIYEFYNSDKIILRVEDTLGNPLSAKIDIREIKHFEGEVFTSHPETGLYVSMFTEEKEFTVLISKKGYHTEEIILKPGKSFEPTKVSLKKL